MPLPVVGSIFQSTEYVKHQWKWIIRLIKIRKSWIKSHMSSCIWGIGRGKKSEDKSRCRMEVPQVPVILRRKGWRRHAETRTVELVGRPHIDRAQQRARVKEVYEKLPSQVRVSVEGREIRAPEVIVLEVNCQVGGPEAEGGQNESDQRDDDGL